ncbi:MAG: ADP-glyceromanno-heptose 6-epimerase [Bacteroidia bacterium]|jgi:ADP-L-glycero-D-manno-heptose 6-epimerase|nr:ADP-glyceromanno-heptose 6-epimerase [Bacteroidia bacterium]
MIVITGAEGFIGSCLVARLNHDGFNDLVLVDDFDTVANRNKNLVGKRYSLKVERKAFFDWLKQNENKVQFIFHIGARTDTTEKDEAIFKELNIDFTKQLWDCCVAYGLPIVYASSAATYGDGHFGYDDDETKLGLLNPMNPYGRSKHEIDCWATAQTKKPFFWAGLKFFNVYGPNEYHKGRMASVIMHAHRQIAETNSLKLFRSHREDYADGEQKRDFIYVQDIVDVCIYLMHNRTHSGLYNLGTGQARTWNDVAHAIFNALGKPASITYIDIPEDIRDTYQYFTEANMQKLREAGYTKPFTSIEDGIQDYVKNYLNSQRYL